jgi:hypothetical protein
MNDPIRDSLFDASDDDAFSRSIDRLADGECSAAEEAELLSQLDAVEGGWRQCALALLEARDMRRALSGIERRVGAVAAVETAPMPVAAVRRSSSRRHVAAPWFVAALASLLAFAVGYAVAPGASLDERLAGGGTIESKDSPSGGTDIATSVPTSEDARDASGGAMPEIMNVVYRPEGSTEERSAPLPVYESNEAWAQVLDEAVRKSEADLAAKRAILREQGVDIERQILLQPVVTDGKEMLVPVETFEVVPLSLASYH